MTKLESSLILFLLCPIIAIWRGFVLSKLWLWFVVAQFGLQPLSVAMAYGICLVAGILVVVPQASTNNQTSDTEFQKTVSYSISFGIFYPLILLFFGWIVTFFI